MKKLLSLFALAAAVLVGGALTTARAETLYISSHSVPSWVGAYHAATGKTIKEKFIRSDAPPRGLAVAGNKLYVAGLTGVSVYDATTGEILKERFIDVETAIGLVLSGDRLYLGAERAVRCYDVATGKPTAGFTPIQTAEGESYSSAPGLAISDHKLYVTNGDHSVGVYDATTGAVINAALITGLDFPYGVAVAGNRLFVTSGPAVVEYDAGAGKVVHASYIPEVTLPSGLCLSGSHLYVSGETRVDTAVVAYDLATDKPVADFHGVEGTAAASFLAVSGPPVASASGADATADKEGSRLAEYHQVRCQVGLVVHATPDIKGRRVGTLDDGQKVRLAGEKIAGTSDVFALITKDPGGEAASWIKIETPLAGYIYYCSYGADGKADNSYIVPSAK